MGVIALTAKDNILRLFLSSLFIFAAFPITGACQVNDELTAKMSSVMKEADISPEMVPLIQEKAERATQRPNTFSPCYISQPSRWKKIMKRQCSG